MITCYFPLELNDLLPKHFSEIIECAKKQQYGFRIRLSDDTINLEELFKGLHAICNLSLPLILEFGESIDPESEMIQKICIYICGNKVLKQIILGGEFSIISPILQQCLNEDIDCSLTISSNFNVDEAISLMREHHFSFLQASANDLSDDVLAELQKSHILLNVQGADTISEMSRLLDSQVVGIITTAQETLASLLAARPIIGYTDGVYDLFHVGHLNMITAASNACDFLIVGVHGDDVVEDYKNRRPIIDEQARRQVVGALACVNRAVINTTRDKEALWWQHRFDLVLIGDDWKGTERWNIFERKLGRLGVKVLYIPYTKGISTTDILRKIELLHEKRGAHG